MQLCNFICSYIILFAVNIYSTLIVSALQKRFVLTLILIYSYTLLCCKNSSVGSPSADGCQGRGRGFESRFPLTGKGREACPDELREVPFPAQEKNLSLFDEGFFL